MDLINDAPIVSLNGNEFVGVEGEDYVNRVITKLGMDKSSVQNLYYHYMGGNEIMKSSILAVPIVIEKGVIIQPWRKGHNKNLKTGVTAAPISIGGIRYICCVVNTRNAQKKNSPYSIRLFDNTQIRDMLQSNIVHHSTTSTSQPSDTSNANPLTVAKVLQKYLLDKNSQEKDVDDNEDNNSTDTTNENKQYNKNRNMKQTIKLRESELRRMIAESVKSVLNEIGDTDKGQDALGQVYGRALRRAQMLGDKGAASRRLRKIAHDAEDKAYSEREKYNLFTGFSKFDNAINTGYAKAENNEAINRKIGRIVSECLKRNLR